MKIIFSLLILFSSPFIGRTQSGFNFCATAINLCDYENNPVDGAGVHNLSFPFNSTNSVCQGNKTRVFMRFECWFGGTSNTIGGTVLKYTSLNNLSALTSTSLKIHGPFNEGQNYCDLINSYLSPTAYNMTHAAPNQQQINLPLQSGKVYYLEFLINSCQGTLNFSIDQRLLTCVDEPPCQDCLPTFQPAAGKYVASSWVKVINPPAGTTTFKTGGSFVGPKLEISDASGVVELLHPVGEIIDGWQKIEGQFVITNPLVFKVKLLSGAHQTLFDDIRVYPNDGSAITYVYDPITYRLMAELDERNYATLYEYDEEGKLIRIKKETEKGVMTIQENRDNNSINNAQ